MNCSRIFCSDQSQYFDNHSYYRFYHEKKPNRTLAMSDNTEERRIDMLPSTTSSENWQLYYQQDRWFIRPYAISGGDKGQWVNYQLDLAEDSQGAWTTVLAMRVRDGELRQQWMFTQVNDGDGGYGFKIRNGVKGNSSWLSLTGTPPTLGMRSGDEGTLWRIEKNPGIEPNNENSYEPVENVEVRRPDST